MYFRLGLLPIDSRRVRHFLNKSDCSCAEHCGKCGVQYSLSVICGEQGNQLVTHFDIVPIGQNSPMPVPLIDEIEKPFPDVVRTFGV